MVSVVVIGMMDKNDIGLVLLIESGNFIEFVLMWWIFCLIFIIVFIVGVIGNVVVCVVVIWCKWMWISNNIFIFNFVFCDLFNVLIFFLI